MRVWPEIAGKIIFPGFWNLHIPGIRQSILIMPASPLDVEAQISGGGNRWLLETSYFACRVLELVSAGTILSPWKNKTIRIAPLSLKINSLFIFLGLCVVVFHCNCVHHRRRFSVQSHHCWTWQRHLHSPLFLWEFSKYCFYVCCFRDFIGLGPVHVFCHCGF